MSNKQSCVLLLCLLAMFLITVAGCSDDDESVVAPIVNDDGSTWSNAEFANYDALIENIAPPVYSSATLSPALDSFWTEGDYPLLGKVFSEEEPMSLYNNLNTFKQVVSELELFILKNDSGDFALDTSLSEGDMSITDMVTFTELTGSTAIPSGMQTVMGTSVDVDYLVDMHWPEFGANDIMQVGFSADATHETMLVFWVMEETDLITCSFGYLAQHNPVDSSIVMQGVVFKDYGDGTSARWIYDISSVDETDFAYRMSWYSDEYGNSSGIGCIIGGGNKDVEFALSYREYVPADSTDHVASMAMQQVFGPDYTEGTSLISSFSDYLAPTLFFVLEDFPSALLTSPWAE